MVCYCARKQHNVDFIITCPFNYRCFRYFTLCLSCSDERSHSIAATKIPWLFKYFNLSLSLSLFLPPPPPLPFPLLPLFLCFLPYSSLPPFCLSLLLSLSFTVIKMHTPSLTTLVWCDLITSAVSLTSLPSFSVLCYPRPYSYLLPRSVISPTTFQNDNSKNKTLAMTEYLGHSDTHSVLDQEKHLQNKQTKMFVSISAWYSTHSGKIPPTTISPLSHLFVQHHT